MKAHPGSAMLHVRLKRSSLCRFFRTRIQKHHYLISRKKVCLPVVPIGCGVIAEIVWRRLFRNPSLGFPEKADMGLIILAGRERDHSRRGLAPTLPQDGPRR